MLRLSIIFFLTAVGASIVLSERGTCPRITGIPVSLQRLRGRWFEFARNQNHWDNGQKCVEQVWSLPRHGVSTVIHNSLSPMTNDYLTAVADVILKKDVLQFDIHAPFSGIFNREFKVLDTDYNNYLIMWGCKYYGSNHTENISIFTRHSDPVVDIDYIMWNVATKYNLIVNQLAIIDNHNCR
ncbi:uncharacterized protein LOC130663345 [Microplitis mediator]|uniref:uncharacterized protein LOC130663345 n=1 Tax=Microplitis mediator TaxID=375433 RepID=UPI00255769B7|nr:uncharacterized protein LOC130663345 [Microplitis mediator]